MLTQAGGVLGPNVLVTQLARPTLECINGLLCTLLEGPLSRHPNLSFCSSTHLRWHAAALCGSPAAAGNCTLLFCTRRSREPSALSSHRAVCVCKQRRAACPPMGTAEWHDSPSAAPEVLDRVRWGRPFGESCCPATAVQLVKLELGKRPGSGRPRAVIL